MRTGFNYINYSFVREFIYQNWKKKWKKAVNFVRKILSTTVVCHPIRRVGVIEFGLIMAIKKLYII